MAGFLYFVETGKEGVASIETLKAGGIYYAFEDEGFLGMPKCVFTRAGPGGKTGWLLGDEKALGKMQVGHFPDQQTWRKIHGTQSQVGVYNDHHPTPSELERKTMLRGYPLELLGGNEWLVPVWCAYINDKRELILPCYLDRDDDGKWISGEIQERYQKLADIGGVFWDKWEPANREAIETGKDQVVDYEFSIDDAMFVLSKNYRVGAEECLLLRLFADKGKEVCFSVMELLCDCDAALLIMLKKKETDTTFTNAGDKD